MRGPLSVGGSGIRDVQFELDDAFVTSATLDVDAGSSAPGTVDLVVAANGFHKETPTNPPPCDCSSGAFLAGNLSVAGIGFTVPAARHDHVRARNAGAQRDRRRRQHRDLAERLDDSHVPGKLVRQRRRRRRRPAERPRRPVQRIQIDLANLEPAFPFTPIFVDGRQH